MNKISLWIGASLCWFSFTVNAGELLGHISEDTAQPISDVKPSQSEDRRIIYRVICSPEDEQLPDCEQPLTDNETIETVRPIESAEDTNKTEATKIDIAEETSQPKQTIKPSKSKTIKNTGKAKSSKKAKTSKKTQGKNNKKSAAKKLSAKKKKH